jgi:hypothetical protein
MNPSDSITGEDVVKAAILGFLWSLEGLLQNTAWTKGHA